MHAGSNQAFCSLFFHAVFRVFQNNGQICDKYGKDCFSSIRLVKVKLEFHVSLGQLSYSFSG